MAEMTWRAAITKVLSDAGGEPLTAGQIAERIIEGQLRVNFGATPVQTVYAQLARPIKENPATSPFIRVGKGLYALPSVVIPPSAKAGPVVVDIDEDDMGLINAFGMFWSRDRVEWKHTGTKLLGVQAEGSTPVDFAEQDGVYLLYDGSRVIYVGRTTTARLGKRLSEHTRSRLAGRWDRFSWFGVRAVTDAGALKDPNPGQLTIDALIETMEALLIEGLEPPQNRKRGDGFTAVEYLQATDPALTKAHKQEQFIHLAKNAGLI